MNSGNVRTFSVVCPLSYNERGRRLSESEAFAPTGTFAGTFCGVREEHEAGHGDTSAVESGVFFLHIHKTRPLTHCAFSYCFLTWAHSDIFQKFD